LLGRSVDGRFATRKKSSFAYRGGKMRSREPWTSVALQGAVLLWAGIAGASALVPQTPLPGSTIPKYVDPLPTFVGVRVQERSLTVEMLEFQQEVLPASEYAGLSAPFDAGTYVWGYKVDDRPPHFPGFTVEGQRFIPSMFRYVNNLEGPGGEPTFLQKYLTVDQTLHWANPLGLDCTTPPLPAACFEPYQGPVPTAVHMHGDEVPSAFDGGPDQWFTPNGLRGPGYASLFPVPGNQAVYRYPNSQEATTMFFHDHTLGATRINLYSGLAAFFLLRDHFDSGRIHNPLRLPAGEQEVEIALQDRMFDTNRQLFFPDMGDNPTIHPFWLPEFFGDVIVVNGKSWPYLDVEPRRYRLRFVNGSNARFYNVALIDQSSNPGPVIWQIGTDGGRLDTPVPIAPPARMLIGPGERADVIVDFSTVPFGTVLTLVNDANAPFPNGDPVDPETTAQIMQFRVVNPLSSKDHTCNPDSASIGKKCHLRPSPIVRLVDPVNGTIAPNVDIYARRQLVLTEIMGPNGPVEVLLNNTKWSGLTESSIMAGDPQPIPDSVQVLGNSVTETPRVGSTEEWEIINLTGDAHPIHLHLVQFQLLNRQIFDPIYQAVWESAFPGGVWLTGDGPPLPYLTVNADNAIGGNPPIGQYLFGDAAPPDPREAGWKDTVVMYPGQVTRIVVRFAPQDWPVRFVDPGENFYPFDPTLILTGNACKDKRRDRFGNPPGPGYAWHCHIVDHEDNEMMRPMIVTD
jgi:FtsP/CotA-like multicopper oxidase with cupredoxin domain